MQVDTIIDLDDKVAIITCTAQGIGRAIAHLFAAQGARVVIADSAKAALFLVSDLASFVQGHGLYVDGSLTAQLQDAAATAIP